MTQIKFGINQLKNPTPAIWEFRIKVFTIVCGIVIGWVGTADFIPSKPSGIIQSILGLLLSIANSLLPLIGAETIKKQIPIEDVKVIDTK